MRLLLLAALVALSSANLAPLFEHEKKIDGEYIVVLKHDVDLDEFRNWVDNRFANEVRIHIKREFRKVFKGFEATMDQLALRELRSQDDVAFVEEDMIVEALEEAASWGLDRVDQRGLPLDGQANFPGTGAGVTAYIIDTGIYPGNQYFESRAEVAYDAIGDGEEGIDCNGHGTHCAGTIGSNPYGIARDASLRGVRVLGCFGSGSTSGVVAGMDWVAANHDGPSIASMSLGGGSSTAMNRAVEGMVGSGVAVSVAAGNDNNDACFYSPAGSPSAITVGATELQSDKQDVRASFSNYGECVDIFAPGKDILSTWIGSPDATNTISGTSMACPHVTGALCVLLGKYPNLNPENLEKKLIEVATKDVIADVGNGSPNELLYIGTDAVRAKPRLRFGSPNGVKMMQQNGFNSRDIIQLIKYKQLHEFNAEAPLNIAAHGEKVITWNTSMRLLLLAVLVALSSANLAPLFKHEKKINGEYIVVLKHDVDLDKFRNWVDNRFANEVGIHIKREFRKVFKGFEATMDQLALREIRSQDNVAFVEEDMIVEKFEKAASWGLDRVDQRGLPLDGDANFPGTGAGVTAYILDTGIYPGNQYFESRAEVAFDVFDGDGTDCNGHGTHCAGTIGSNPYGIAREASLRGVRVLGCSGSGSVSGVVAGMDWVAANHTGPSIASMSLGGSSSPALDNAVEGMVQNGVAVSVAAGNYNNDACFFSPSGAPSAITVAATELQSYTQDVRASFSNYGECVDIFAPGVDILSTWIGSPDATNTISGTSMACPHVTGALCVLLGNDNTLSPEDLEKELIRLSTKDVIDDVGNQSPNRLLYIGTEAVRVKPSFGSPDGVKMMQQNGLNSRDIIQ
ncbi:uncharacterized protein [Amphiura filiformis]|uniref:uncharacterized protein n=1 Tax=Amphiura filiformis TaxID=82378 RepID=UPI003B20EC4B